jgi:anti-sigma regulatory factor (Ser/Thr protein kinase)
MTKTIQKTIAMPAHPKFLSEVRQLLAETLSGVKLPQREKDLVILAVDEAVSSIVTYAKYKGYNHDVAVTIDIDDVRFKASINDSLNVFEINGGMADATRLAKERTFTMGIFLMRQIMDEVVYTYRKGFENELQLIKFL